MPAAIVDGKAIQMRILEETREKVSKLKQKPFLGVILVGNSPASISYVNKKKEACAYCGITAEIFQFHESASETSIREKIMELNLDSEVNGILVQLPLPEKFRRQRVLDTVNPDKDVDGLTSTSQGILATGKEGIFSATALAVLKI